MSLASGADNPAIDNLVQSSLEGEHDLRLEWIHYKEIVIIKPTQFDNVHYARRYNVNIILVVLGSSGECTPTFVSEFSRLYSLPTHKYNNNDNNFRRYSIWLEGRNNMI